MAIQEISEVEIEELFPQLFLTLPGTWVRFELSTPEGIENSIQSFVKKNIGDADHLATERRLQALKLRQEFEKLAGAGVVVSFFAEELGFGIKVPLSIHLVRPQELLLPTELLEHPEALRLSARVAFSQSTPSDAWILGDSMSLGEFDVHSRHLVSKVEQKDFDFDPSTFPQEARDALNQAEVPTKIIDELLNSAEERLAATTEVGSIQTEHWVVSAKHPGITIVRSVCPVLELETQVVGVMNQIVRVTLENSTDSE